MHNVFSSIDLLLVNTFAAFEWFVTDLPPRTCDNTGFTCIEECPGDTNDLYQWCGSCSWYIACQGTIKTFQKCAADLVFNDRLKICSGQSPVCRECLLDTPTPTIDPTASTLPTDLTSTTSGPPVRKYM